MFLWVILFFKQVFISAIYWQLLCLSDFHFSLDFPGNWSSFELKGLSSLNIKWSIFLAWKLTANPMFSKQVQAEKFTKIGSAVCRIYSKLQIAFCGPMLIFFCLFFIIQRLVCFVKACTVTILWKAVAAFPSSCTVLNLTVSLMDQLPTYAYWGIWTKLPVNSGSLHFGIDSSLTRP